MGDEGLSDPSAPAERLKLVARNGRNNGHVAVHCGPPPSGPRKCSYLIGRISRQKTGSDIPPVFMRVRA